MTADKVFHNGTFITMEEAQPQATAIAVKDGRIVWVGDSPHHTAWIGPNTKVIDLQGAYGYPGFIDSHAHIYYMGLAKLCIQLEDAKDKQTVLQRVKERIATAAPDEWILGVGWNEGNWPEKSLPTAIELDEVSPNHPVVLRRDDTHSIWVNSRVLQICGINAEMADLPGGKIYRNNLGHPTGILVDTAALHVKKFMPPPTPEETIQIVKAGMEEAVQKGVTMIHNASTYPWDFAALKTLSDQNTLPLRVYLMGVPPDPYGAELLQTGPQVYGPRLETRCLKVFVDGALGSRGAALLEPYSDDNDNDGLLIWDQDKLLQLLQAAKAKGFQVAAHAIGDKAIRKILDAYEKVGCQGLRWRVEHVQLIHPNDIPRFKQLGVIAAMQPLHATVDMPWFEDRAGHQRTVDGAFVWRSLLDAGAVICGGSDAPVVDINPFWGMYAAITRQNFKGYPAGGWYGKQCVSRLEALKMYTVDGAYACFKENELGSLKVGKLADMVFLPENLLTCDIEKFVTMKCIK